MTIEENKQILRRFFDEVLTGKDIDVIDELAAPDFDEQSPLPGQGTGIEGLKDRARMLTAGMTPTSRSTTWSGRGTWSSSAGRTGGRTSGSSWGSRRPAGASRTRGSASTGSVTAGWSRTGTSSTS